MDVSWSTEGKTLNWSVVAHLHYANSGVQVALMFMCSYLLHGIWKWCIWAEVPALGSASHALRGFSNYSSSIIFKGYLKTYFPLSVKLVHSRKKYWRQNLICLLALGIKVQGWLLLNSGLLLSAVLPRWPIHMFIIINKRTYILTLPCLKVGPITFEPCNSSAHAQQFQCLGQSHMQSWALTVVTVSGILLVKGSRPLWVMAVGLASI